MAECHPVAFRWPMQAQATGATFVHGHPRFRRTTAMTDLHAPSRAGTDIACQGGLIHYVLNNERWNAEPFFRDYLVHYTNAATIVAEEFRDTEELEGVFSGLMEYTGGTEAWPFNGFVGMYDSASWQYAHTEVPPEPRGRIEPPSGNPDHHNGQPVPQRPPFEPLIRSLRKPPPRRDETLQDPRTVFQLLKRHFSRYTVDMVEQVTGCPREMLLQVAETILANSGRDRTTAWAYAVGWTQHTNGPQMIGCCALLQLLLGNIGRPGGGILALRGHASIQGSTDVPTLYHSIHGYLSAPSALRKHDTLRDYLADETVATGYWANEPKFMVSYLKSMYGEAATRDNQFGYDWHPKILGDHSHLPMFVAMADGKVKGMLLIGQNPATSINAKTERAGLRKLEWLVVKDNWVHESANFWKSAPEIKNGEVKREDIKTEVFFFPSAQVAENEGSFTNTQRMLQWHYKAAEAPEDCRS